MTDKLRDAAQQAPMAYYALVIKADSGYESTTEGRCTADQYGAAMAALHGTAALAHQDAQTEQEPVAYMLPRDGGDCAVFREPSSFATRYSPKGWIPLYTAPQPAKPAQRVMLTDEEIEQASVKGDGTHSGFARAVIEAYERKNGKEAP